MTAMRIRLFILATTLCMVATGCSSLGDLITMAPMRDTDVQSETLLPDALQANQNHSKSLYVFNSSPYALSLDVEEMEQDALQTPVHGDGGVSLNAYAACLTMKVMF